MSVELMKWHYAFENEEVGPVDDEDLKALLKSGQLSGKVEVWKAGMAEWMPAESLAELLPYVQGASAGGVNFGVRENPYAKNVRASFTKRFVAFVIDNVITFVCFWFTVELVLSAVWPDVVIGIIEVIKNFAVSILCMVVYYRVLYFAIHGYTLATKGQSLGKMMLDLKIVCHFSEGKPSMLKMFVWRYLFVDVLLNFTMLLFGMVFFYPIAMTVLGFLQIYPTFMTLMGVLSFPLLINYLAALGDSGRALHDKLAGTRVAEVKVPTNKYLG